MTGQVKEQVLTRLGELGVEIAGGQLGFRPRLLDRDEFLGDGADFDWLDLAGIWRTRRLPAHSLAFTCCQVPVCYVAGETASIVLERTDGGTETFDGDELDPDTSRAVLERTDTYRWITVTLPIAAR
jgi:hypothetical protein